MAEGITMFLSHCYQHPGTWNSVYDERKFVDSALSHRHPHLIYATAKPILFTEKGINIKIINGTFHR